MANPFIKFFRKKDPAEQWLVESPIDIRIDTREEKPSEEKAKWGDPYFTKGYFKKIIAQPWQAVGSRFQMQYVFPPLGLNLFKNTFTEKYAGAIPIHYNRKLTIEIKIENGHDLYDANDGDVNFKYWHLWGTHIDPPSSLGQDPTAFDGLAPLTGLAYTNILDITNYTGEWETKLSFEIETPPEIYIPLIQLEAAGNTVDVELSLNVELGDYR